MKTCKKIAIGSAFFVVGVVILGCNFAYQILGGSEVSETVVVVPIDEVTAAPLTEPVLTDTLTVTLIPPEAATSTLELITPTPVVTEIIEAVPTKAGDYDPDSCIDTPCVVSGTFLLNRPIAAPGRLTIDPSNRFGEYQPLLKTARHGVDFLNSLGTPVLAAADGLVIVAGDDSKTNYGYQPGMYGNLVILEHKLPGVGKPVYTLYAHLSEVLVKKGESVVSGQEIGLVGMSGRVTGSTLTFEVRHQENLFHSARNPELWLEALIDENGQFFGSLAGRIVDGEGKFVPIKNIVIERLAGPGLPALDQVYLQTYTSDFLTGRPPWQENFAVGDLPAGRYQISFWYDGMQQKEVEVEPGKLTVVTFVLD